MNFRERIKLHRTLMWRRCAVLCCLCCLCLLACPPGDGRAEVGGIIDYNYGISKITTTDSTGTSNSHGSNFTQNYSLNLDKNLTSTLRLATGARAQFTDNESTLEGETSTNTSSRISPYASLDYSHGMFSAGGGVSRVMLDSESSGLSSPTFYRDTYNARLTWKPEDLPNSSLIYSNSDLYDEQRTIQDVGSQSLLFSTSYVPLKSLKLDYSANYSTSTDRLQGFTSESVGQFLRASYSDQFLNNRLLFSTGYGIAKQDSTVVNNGSALGGGVLTTRVLPLPNAGFFSISTPPATPLQGALSPRPEVVNGDANTSITLASPTATANPLNFGMQFNGALDPTLTLNMIRVLVTSNLANQQGLEGKAALLQSAFVWSVYVSANNIDWTPVTVTSQRFANIVDTLNPNGVFGFEINFNSVSAVRFIKVVTRPVFLTDTVFPLLTSVSVSKLEAFLISVPTPPGTSKSSSQLSGVFDMYLKAILFNLPLLTYDLSFNLSHSKGEETDLTYRYNVVNGLSLYHIFNPVFSSSARLAREDGVEPDSSRSSNLFSASLIAIPLPTLNHTFNVSARQDNDRGLTKTSYSISSSNSAELYRGVSTNLTLSGSLSDSSDGEKQKSLNGTMGLNLVPHRTLSVNMGASLIRSMSSGGGKPDITTNIAGADVSVGYTPVPAIYLFVNSTIRRQTGQPFESTISFGGGWSPFQGGALQFNTAYNEVIITSSKTRTFSQGIRWKINQKTTFSLGYFLSTTNGSDLDSESEGVNGSLKIVF